jgi:hypothetical protein
MGDDFCAGAGRGSYSSSDRHYAGRGVAHLTIPQDVFEAKADGGRAEGQ